MEEHRKLFFIARIFIFHDFMYFYLDFFLTLGRETLLTYLFNV